MIRLRAFLIVLILAAAAVAGWSARARVSPDFDRPDCLDVSADGRIVALNDSGNGRVIVMDRDFRLKTIIDCEDFYNVWGLALTDTGEIVITNERALRPTLDPAERKAVAVVELIFFALDGRELRRLQWFGERGPLVSPSTVFPLRDGGFLVPETRSNQILHIDATGNLLSAFGGYGFRGDRLFYPNDAVRLADGSIAVVDSFNSRLPVFSPDGRLLREIATRGTAEAQVMFPQAFSLDRTGGLWVAELYTMRVSHFDARGAYVGCVPLKDKADDRPIVQLFDVAWAPAPDELLVADTLNSCVYRVDPATGEIKKKVTGFSR